MGWEESGTGHNISEQVAIASEPSKQSRMNLFTRFLLTMSSFLTRPDRVIFT